MAARRHLLEELVREVVANYPTWGADRIRRFIAEKWVAHGRSADELPSVSTIGRIKSRATAAELQQYEYVRWPETFEAGLLPWEAARTVLDLVRRRGATTLGRARWYWQVHLAAPDIPTPMHTEIANQLAAHEAAGLIGDEWTRSIEIYLAHRAWADENRADYEAALQRRPEIKPWEPAYPLSDDMAIAARQYSGFNDMPAGGLDQLAAMRNALQRRGASGVIRISTALPALLPTVDAIFRMKDGELVEGVFRDAPTARAQQAQLADDGNATTKENDDGARE